MPLTTAYIQNLRRLVTVGFVVIAVLYAQSQDALREITRPLVIKILSLCGLDALDKGDLMIVANLEVPWTRDCAGVNLLVIMLALAVWVNREEPTLKKFCFRVALMIPAALAANVLRVLSLIGYRMVAYPVVESPQTHYFIGFVWIIPFLTAVTPRAGRHWFHAFFETFHAVAVIALLTPIMAVPNGGLLSIAALLALSQCKLRNDMSSWRPPLTALWIVAGVTLAIANMESFWLPWLLCCPLLLDFKWIFTISGILTMLSTQSMFIMQSWAPPLAWIGIGLVMWNWLKKNPATKQIPDSEYTPNRSLIHRSMMIGSTLCFFAPFLASTLLAIGGGRWSPPQTMEYRPLDTQGFEVILPSQPENIALACYSAEGGDRHHTVKVCLKYRGIELTPHPEIPEIYSDGKHWIREFFHHSSKLIDSYPSYLKHTFSPGSDLGVHLIFISPKESTTPHEFKTSSESLAKSFHQLCLGSAADLSEKSQ